MLRKIVNILSTNAANISKCDGNKLVSVLWRNSLKINKNCSLCGTFDQVRQIHATWPLQGGEDRKLLSSSMPKRDEGADGENSVDLDFISKSKDDLFPDETLPDRLFDGVPFRELPVVNIKSTKNNTIMNVTDYLGMGKLLRSCGVEGFKNTRKGTNVAAQATAISLTTLMLDSGYRTVRVRVQGLGPGRTSAIKGLQMGGIKIVSITDNTRVSWNPPRPRKQRRV